SFGHFGFGLPRPRFGFRASFGHFGFGLPRPRFGFRVSFGHFGSVPLLGLTRSNGCGLHLGSDLSDFGLVALFRLPGPFFNVPDSGLDSGFDIGDFDFVLLVGLFGLRFGLDRFVPGQFRLTPRKRCGFNAGGGVFLYGLHLFAGALPYGLRLITG